MVADRDDVAAGGKAQLDALAMATVEGLHGLSLAAGGGTEWVRGAYCWYSSSFAFAFNGAGLFAPELFAEDALLAIEAYFRKRNRPYSLVTIDGMADEGRRGLYARGYYEFDTSPAMLLEGQPLSLGEASGAVIRQVDTPEDLAAFRSVVCTVFHISPLEADLILNDSILEVPSVRHYISLLGGKAVAGSSLVISGKLPSIWNVGTLADYRKRGISTELMHRMALDAAHAGFSSTMLLASPVGLPLYKRLGYQTLSTVRMFAPSHGPDYGYD